MKFIYKLDHTLKQTNRQKRKKQMYYVINECLFLYSNQLGIIRHFGAVLGEILVLCGVSLFSAIQNILGALSLILLGDE